MKTATELQKEFGMAGVTMTDLGGGYPVIEVANGLATARIALHGGQVMTFQPAGERPVLWMSETSQVAAGKAIRGGIPVCWPWFGNHATVTGMPSHGVVRTRFWTLACVRALPQGETELVLAISDDVETRARWPYAFELELTVTVGTELTVSLKMTNPGEVAWRCEAALHSYLCVGDITRVGVKGLDGVEYVDKVRSGVVSRQVGDVHLDQEVDRVYWPTSAEVVVTDAAWERQVVTAKEGSDTTVVWNPWIDKGRALGDFHTDGHLGMVCVETARTAEDAILLSPRESAVMRARHSVRRL